MMKHTRKTNPASRSIASVTPLRCRDVWQVDPAPLNTLFSTMPEPEAESLICRALEAIAHRLDLISGASLRSDLGEIGALARRVSAVARQIGLTEVAEAARHVAQAATQKDGAALAATMGRLERGFDLAVAQVWSVRGHGS